MNLDADITAGLLDPELAALTVANMVLRVLRNPSGLRAETTGPFSRTYDTTAAAGLQRGDLVFVAGTRADKTLHARVILIEKAATTTPATTSTPTVAPTTAVTPSSTPSAMGTHS